MGFSRTLDCEREGAPPTKLPKKKIDNVTGAQPINRGRDTGAHVSRPWNLQSQWNTIANAGPWGSYFESGPNKKFKEVVLQASVENPQLEWSDETWG